MSESVNHHEHYGMPSDARRHRVGMPTSRSWFMPTENAMPEGRLRLSRSGTA